MQISFLNDSDCATPPAFLPVGAGTLRNDYKSIGENKGNSRIWIQNKRLETANFFPSTPYLVLLDHANKTITLRRVEHVSKETREVSRRVKNDRTTPIIDLNSSELTNFYKGMKRVKTTYRLNEICISLHHEDVAQLEREERFRKHMAEGRLTEGTFCAGGCISTAAVHDSLEQIGLACEVSFIVERENKYIEAALHNNHAITDKTCIIHGSLEEIEPADLSPVDILQVSLPCTGHSKSGKSKNKIKHAEQHKDCTAVVGYFPLARKSNAAIMLSENVVEAQNSESYCLLKAEMTRMGYHLFEFILDGDDAGTLEQRKRYWLLAVSRGLVDFDELSIATIERIHQTFADIMDDIPANDDSWSQNEYLAIKAERDQAAGKGFARQFIFPESEQYGVIAKDYAKRRSTEPFVKREDGLERLFTVREHARGKRIPASLVAGECNTTAHQILGQSILYAHPHLVLKPLFKSLMKKGA